MTFSIGHVEGGTGAGRRRVIDKKYVPWACECRVNPGYLVKCIDCGTKRP